MRITDVEAARSICVIQRAIDTDLIVRYLVGDDPGIDRPVPAI
jgi:hypothetical protein